MIEVVPNLDELAISHEARRMAIVDCSSRHEHLKLLQQELGATVPEANDLPRLTLLALASGMQPQEYARSHSIMAVRRVAARDGQRHEHGWSPMAASFSRRLGMLTQRDGAVVCHACIDEMLAEPRRVPVIDNDAINSRPLTYRYPGSNVAPPSTKRMITPHHG